MRKQVGVDDDAMLYFVHDLDTHEDIRGVVWADDETGEYCVFAKDAEDRYIHDGETAQTEVKKGRIKLIHRNDRAAQEANPQTGRGNTIL